MLFQDDFSWSDPLGWLAHVAFFVLVCAALVEMLHHLQVTHRKLLDSEARLLEADRRKNEFLAMLAHELRNPLALDSQHRADTSASAPTSRRPCGR